MQAANLDRGLEASYEMALLIAKTGKPHTIGEDLLKPALSIFAHSLQKSDAAVAAVNTIPLSNDSVRRRID